MFAILIIFMNLHCLGFALYSLCKNFFGSVSLIHDTGNRNMLPSFFMGNYIYILGLCTLSQREKKKKLELLPFLIFCCFQLEENKSSISVQRQNNIHSLKNIFACCHNQLLSSTLGQCKYRLCVISLAFKTRI